VSADDADTEKARVVAGGNARPAASRTGVFLEEIGDAREGAESLARAVLEQQAATERARIEAQERADQRRSDLIRHSVRACVGFGVVALMLGATVAALAWGGQLSLAGFGLDVKVGEEGAAEFDADAMNDTEGTP
jgi:hypothetical protein